VVATNIAGIRSLDNCNEYISFVNIKSPSDLSEQILKLIHNTDLREEISKKGIIHVKTEFSEQRIAAQMLGFYEDISR
jgi:glycosyltransferase involved in cell wall biosynthesis